MKFCYKSVQQKSKISKQSKRNSKEKIKNSIVTGESLVASNDQTSYDNANIDQVCYTSRSKDATEEKTVE